MKKAILILLLLTNVLFAHQITAKKNSDGTYKAAFWAHGKYQEFNIKQLKGATAYDANNNVIKTGIDYSKGPTLLTTKKPAMITLTFDAGYWVKGDNGYESIDPTAYKGIVYNTLKSIKYGKRYFQWNESFLKPTGIYLEVLPLINPFSIKRGEKLPVLVLKEGKAYANAEFETSDYEDLNLKTNTYGIAYIPIKNTGLQIIAAKYYGDEINDSNVNKITIQSSISFEVKQ
jgi:nickel transport protein